MQPAASYTGLDVTREFLENVPRVVDLVTFKTGRKCFDGLCCFFPDRPHGVAEYKDWLPDKALLICHVDVKPWQVGGLADRDLPELVLERELRVESLCACEELQLELAVEDDRLVIAMGCGVYEDRPPPCRAYPEKEGKPCTFNTYCGGPRHQLETQRRYWGYSGGVALFLLALRTRDYPGYGRWAIGRSNDRESGEDYYLIPVPWFSNYRELIPDWDESKGKLVRAWTPWTKIAIVLALMWLWWQVASRVLFYLLSW